MSDPYVYPGTDILVNKEELRDRDALEAFERVMTAARMETLPMRIPPTEAGYRQIHRYIFQDVYDWAGAYRTVNISKAGHMFCLVPHIADQMRRRFTAVRADTRRGRFVRRDLAARAAVHIAELNAIHPFREGNGRTLRAFLERLAMQAGCRVALERIDPETWAEASIHSFDTGDHTVMARVIEQAMVSS